MPVKISHREIHERCLVEVPGDSDFTIYNLPLGIFKAPGRPAGVGMAIGDHILDLRVLADNGLLQDIGGKDRFETDTLNSLLGSGQELNRRLRRKVQGLLTGEIQGLSLISDTALVEARTAEMRVPVTVGDYTDFYSSIEHATNVGKLFRGAENALMPNWKHLPVGYHGRASSIITTGTAVRRPKGQILDPETGKPVFSASRKLDFELELAFLVGKDSAMGQPVPITDAAEHICGFVLMNDWSARDIQQWEYQPLGPFLGKSFATSISPWVVSTDALEGFRKAVPEREVKLLPYLFKEGLSNYDIRLEVALTTSEGASKVLTETSSKTLYWTPEQQLAHQTVNGCNLRVGDLMASGTISGEAPSAWGSLLEQTFNGREPIEIAPGVQRTFLEDGDEVSMTGHAGEGPYRVGFGILRNRVVPSN